MKKKVIAIILIIIAILGLVVYNVQKGVKEKGRDYTIEDVKEYKYFESKAMGVDWTVDGLEDRIEEIKDNNYVLTPGRYVGTEEQEDDGIPFEEKMKAITTELKAQFEESHKLEEEIKKNLEAIGYEM